jgi:plastocyanin
MSGNRINRRHFLKAAGTGVLVFPSAGWMRVGPQNEAEVAEIIMVRNYRIGRFYFDPIGLHIEPGTMVRWICRANGLSALAFHPDHDNHELRIPEGARPFDSGVLWRGDTFEWTFEVEGTYDYYSRNQEVIGMVGRIVVGSAGGPGENPLGYGAREGRTPPFRELMRTHQVISSQEIVQKGTVPYPADLLGRKPPLH